MGPGRAEPEAAGMMDGCLFTSAGWQGFLTPRAVLNKDGPGHPQVVQWLRPHFLMQGVQV